jgi:hypothetical protein
MHNGRTPSVSAHCLKLYCDPRLCQEPVIDLLGSASLRDIHLFLSLSLLIFPFHPTGLGPVLFGIRFLCHTRTSVYFLYILSIKSVPATELTFLKVITLSVAGADPSVAFSAIGMFQPRFLERIPISKNIVNLNFGQQHRVHI